MLEPINVPETVSYLPLRANDIDAAIKIIAGTARSMGIEIKE